MPLILKTALEMKPRISTKGNDCTPYQLSDERADYLTHL